MRRPVCHFLFNFDGPVFPCVVSSFTSSPVFFPPFFPLVYDFNLCLLSCPALIAYTCASLPAACHLCVQVSVGLLWFFPMVKLIFSFFSQFFVLFAPGGGLYVFLLFLSFFWLWPPALSFFYFFLFCTCIVLFAPITVKKPAPSSLDQSVLCTLANAANWRWSDDPITSRRHLWAQLSSLLLPCDNSLAKLASAHLCEPLELLDESVASHSKSVGEPLRDPQFIQESIWCERPCGEVTCLFIAANL